MDRLLIRCTGCGQAVTILSDGATLPPPPSGPNFAKWIAKHRHSFYGNPKPPIPEAFTLEDNASMEEKA